jgi:HEAT repeat protein
MEAVPPNIKEIVADLANSEKPLTHAGLADLSNLNPDELKYVENVWPSIEVDRRRQVIARMVELAENNFELDFDSVFKTGLKDPDAEIRAKSIEGLWENEETTLISPYIRMLNEDKSEVVQAAATKALSKYALLAEMKKIGPASSGRVSQALLAILADPDKPKEVWRRALEASAPLSSPEVKKAINTAYRSSDLKLKNSAIYAMGRNCDSAWIPTLIKEMASTSVETRYEAAGACGEICDEEAVPPLMKLIQDKDPEVQQAAISALGKIGGVKAKQFLSKCLTSSDEIISEAAEQALKQIATEEDHLF